MLSVITLTPKASMNHRALWAVLTIVASCGFNPLLAQPAQEVSERYVFAVSRLSIPKQLKGLKLVDIQSVPDGSNVINRFSNPMIGLDISLCVYTSPPDTKGPVLMLDSNGKEILEDREDEKNSHHAVFKLTTPSESYLQEYARVIKAISATGFLANPKLDSEFRFMAIPKRKDSPIGYAAELSGTRKLPGDESIPWT